MAASTLSKTPAFDPARRRGDEKLFERYRRSGDRRDRDQLVERFLPLARNLARRYSQDPRAYEDIVQVAAIGLINAIERFDSTRGVSFSSYAVPTIAGEIKRYFRDRSWTVRPPRDLQERVLRVDAATKQFSSGHSRAPTVSELAERLDDLSQEDVLEALYARRAASALSLDTPATQDDDTNTLGERLGTTDGGYALVEQRVLLDSLQRALTTRERAILQMRFVEDMTQAEIGAAVGLSQMQISRLLRQSIDHMSTIARTTTARTTTA
jgi:RNA polymerase sigma-B factor